MAIRDRTAGSISKASVSNDALKLGGAILSRLSSTSPKIGNIGEAEVQKIYDKFKGVSSTCQSDDMPAFQRMCFSCRWPTGLSSYKLRILDYFPKMSGRLDTTPTT